MKTCTALLATSLVAVSVVTGAVIKRENTTSVWNATECSTDDLSVIKEWRNMSSSEKTNYIAAELCLYDLPSASNISNGSVSRRDDLVALHQELTPVIHDVGQFLPWHRLFMKLHETFLRNECNYTGPMTWWDEQQDAGDYLSSPILDADTGFGGNGTGTDYCVPDGPFANVTLHMGPTVYTTSEGFCLKRNVNETLTAGASQSIIDGCWSETTYDEAGISCIGASPHTAGHGGVGGGVEGSIGDIYVSPNDPLFFLHHAFIDRLWWKWQNMDLSTRLYEIGGYDTTDEEQAGAGNATTLTDTLELLGLSDNKQIGDVMDLHNTFLCHEYDY